MKNITIEILGWSGAVMLLVAFALTSNGILAGTSLEYQLINLVGSIVLAAYTYVKKAYPNAVLNIIWGLISIFAIISIVR